MTELERNREETAVAQFGYYPSIHLDALMTAMNNLKSGYWVSWPIIE
jgi:hypothetical protein